MLAVFAVLLGALWLATPAQAARGRVYASDGGYGAPHYRPRSLMLSGDSTLEATRLHWTRWGQRRAVAHGIVRVDDCRPDCATGSWTRYRARLVLSHPKAACGNAFFTHARIVGRGFHWHASWPAIVCPAA